jgi:hypothetical protein
MDSILSFENRAKKRKNLNKNQVEKKIIRVEKAQYIENYKIKIEFTEKVPVPLILKISSERTLILYTISIKILNFLSNSK